MRYVHVEGGEPAGEPEDRVELYRVRDGLIRRFQRFGDLPAALDDAGMSAGDEVAE